MPSDAGTELIEEVSAWEGVSTGEGRFGSTRFLVGRRELGHVHPPSVLDMPLPPPMKRELIERGEVEQHRFTRPESGWVTVRLDGPEGAEPALELLRERHRHALELRPRV